MATIQTFKLVTAVQGLITRDFEAADPNYVVPGHADAIIMGEFVEINAAYKIIPSAAAGASFAVWVEEGRSDVQALRSLTTLFGGTYEADTLVFTGTPALGAKLEVDPACVYGGRTHSGLKIFAAAEVVGFVTRTEASNNGYLRFLQTLV
jgi:hypothetical protein